MRILFAILLPWALMLYEERFVAAMICLALQLTLFGWLIATIWALRVSRASRQKVQQAEEQSHE